VSEDGNQPPLFVDKEILRQHSSEMDALVGIVPDPTVTAETVQEMCLAQGIPPEENIGSRGIIAEREAQAYSPRLDALLLEGLDNGEWIEVTPECWQDLKERIEERRKKSDAGCDRSLGCHLNLRIKPPHASLLSLLDI